MNTNELGTPIGTGPAPTTCDGWGCLSAAVVCVKEQADSQFGVHYCEMCMTGEMYGLKGTLTTSITTCSCPAGNVKMRRYVNAFVSACHPATGLTSASQWHPSRAQQMDPYLYSRPCGSLEQSAPHPQAGAPFLLGLD